MERTVKLCKFLSRIFTGRIDFESSQSDSTNTSFGNQSIMEFPFSKPTETYRIRVTVAIYRNHILSYKNEVIIPSEYLRRTEARAHIQKEISERLVHSNFFRSRRPDYDLVRYTEEATCNTFLRYRILSLKSGEGLIRERI